MRRVVGCRLTDLPGLATTSRLSGKDCPFSAGGRLNIIAFSSTGCLSGVLCTDTSADGMSGFVTDLGHVSRAVPGYRYLVRLRSLLDGGGMFTGGCVVIFGGPVVSGVRACVRASAGNGDCIHTHMAGPGASSHAVLRGAFCGGIGGGVVAGHIPATHRGFHVCSECGGAPRTGLCLCSTFGRVFPSVGRTDFGLTVTGVNHMTVTGGLVGFTGIVGHAIRGCGGCMRTLGGSGKAGVPSDFVGENSASVVCRVTSIFGSVVCVPIRLGSHGPRNGLDSSIVGEDFVAGVTGVVGSSGSAIRRRGTVIRTCTGRGFTDRRCSCDGLLLRRESDGNGVVGCKLFEEIKGKAPGLARCTHDVFGASLLGNVDRLSGGGGSLCHDVDSNSCLVATVKLFVASVGGSRAPATGCLLPVPDSTPGGFAVATPECDLTKLHDRLRSKAGVVGERRPLFGRCCGVTVRRLAGVTRTIGMVFGAGTGNGPVLAGKSFRFDGVCGGGPRRFCGRCRGSKGNGMFVAGSKRGILTNEMFDFGHLIDGVAPGDGKTFGRLVKCNGAVSVLCKKSAHKLDCIGGRMILGTRRHITLRSTITG